MLHKYLPCGVLCVCVCVSVCGLCLFGGVFLEALFFCFVWDARLYALRKMMSTLLTQMCGRSQNKNYSVFVPVYVCVCVYVCAQVSRKFFPRMEWKYLPTFFNPMLTNKLKMNDLALFLLEEKMPSSIWSILQL